MIAALLKNRDLGLLILRLGIGGMFIFHGYPKLMAGPEKWERLGASMAYLGINFFPVFWGFMASFAESVGGLFIIFGWYFRVSNSLLLLTMCVAAFQHLAKGEGLGRASHAIEAGVVFLALIFIGPGRYVMTWNKGSE